MYQFDDDIVMSMASNKSKVAMVEAAIENYESRGKRHDDSLDSHVYAAEAYSVLESVQGTKETRDRYLSFAETVRNSLVTEAIYDLYKKSVPVQLRENNTETSIMRAIVCEYVNEQGYGTILECMKTASTAMSEMYNLITETATKILEAVDKSNPETFNITPEMRDEFFKQLNYNDSEAIADAINSRVSDAVDDFVTANTKDHEDITAALQQAQEKIDNSPSEDEELHEAYRGVAKRKINKIRNAPKSVFHAMVSSLSESVLRNPESHAEFMLEGHLNMDKIVDRAKLMYGFMETLNTSRLQNIDELFITDIIEGLKK